MLGLKRGTVALLPHDPKWEREGEKTARELKEIFGSAAVDAQHVGSTAVKHISAKPIIDIAVAVKNLQDVQPLIPSLEERGYMFRPGVRHGEEMFFSKGDFSADTRTHHIHVIPETSPDWESYILFRDYLNSRPAVAAEYESVKTRLLGEFADDRSAYTAGKGAFISRILRRARLARLGRKTVKVKVDRPLGSVHSKFSQIVYPVNYGYIPGILGGDGEEQDAYLIGFDEPVSETEAQVVGAVYRKNDREDKLVCAPEGTDLSPEEIRQTVDFQEKYFETEIEVF